MDRVTLDLKFLGGEVCSIKSTSILRSKRAMAIALAVRPDPRTATFCLIKFFTINFYQLYKKC